MKISGKVFHLKRKHMTVLGCALAAVLMLGAVNAPAVISASAAQRQLPIYCVQRDQKMISISFDAAWGDVILRQRNGKGSEERAARRQPSLSLMGYPPPFSLSETR